MRLGVCLSLTGRFAPFGREAAQALELWAGMSGHDVEIADDESDPDTFKARFDALRVDLYLGPYGTGLTRVAAEAFDRLIFNHGGAGDDVQALRPGRVVSILAPTSRYAEPFLEQR